ncbi:MAG: mechanosensitive ion channel family protein [Oscillospiraceae bacterium]|nr:mechanosensitive ion channel family protein [Oscillospiraceae bacterium]
MLNNFYLFGQNIDFGAVMGYVIRPVAVIAAAIIVRMIVTHIFRLRARKPNTHIMTDRFLRRCCNVVIYVLAVAAVAYNIPGFRTLATSLLAGSGIVAVGISLAAQASFSNVISGVFLLISHPFSVGDRVHILNPDITGFIEDITMRHTLIRTMTNARVIVPNGVMNTTIFENISAVDARTVQFIDLFLDFNQDLNIARHIVNDVVSAHPLLVDMRKPEDVKKGVPLVAAQVVEMGLFGIRIQASAAGKSAGDAFTLRCECLAEIKRRFDEAGIRLAYQPKHTETN